MDFKLIVLAMIFCHIVDDYYLQGWLASAKQKSWWETNAPQFLYSHDYIWALIMHSFSWTFMIMLPTLLISRFNPSELWYALFAMNVLTHALTDDQKANRKTINLWHDQLIHMTQIICTAWLLY